MRAEDIVGCTFFAAMVIGLVLIIRGGMRKGGGDRSQVKAGLIMEGLAFMFFGLATFYLVRTSPRLGIEGNIWDVHRIQSKSGGSQFRVTSDSGRVVVVRCRYRGPGLREGDRVRVRYIAYNQHLLELTMLSGPFEGWELEEPSQDWSWLVLAGLGLVCGAVVVRGITPQKIAQATSAG